MYQKTFLKGQIRLLMFLSLISLAHAVDTFDDPFEGRALQNPNWQWQNEPANWDVGETRENFLHIESEPNRNLWTSDASHFLYQETNAEVFDVETHFFARWDTFSGVNGLVVKSPADNDWVTLKFWAQGAGAKGHIQYQTKGRQNGNGLTSNAGFTPTYGNTELFFRLRKQDDTYTGWYKTREADPWIEIGVTHFPLTPPLHLGIYAGVAADTGTLTVNYEYFRNTKRLTPTGDVSITPPADVGPDSAAPVTVSISPSQVQSPAVGEPLVLNLNITDGEDVAGYQATLQFDTTALRYISSSNADYLPAGAFVVPTLVNGNQVTLAATSLRGGSHGDGTLATVTFEVIAAKPSVLTLSEVQLTDVDANFLSVNSKNAEVVEATQLRRDNVRLIYFRPSDRPRRQGIGTHLDTLIKDVQAFYAKQMQHHQAKTFTYETHTDGTAVVHYVDGQNTDTYYQDHTFNRVRGEIQKQFDTSKHIYLVAVDLRSERVNEGTQGGVCGIGGGNWTSRDNKTWQRDSGGLAVIPASGTCFNLYVTAHELGHTFGLEHDFRDDNYLMAYGSQTRLSGDAAEWLSVHPYFNALQTGANQQTAFEMLSAHASGLNFQITDANGLHQAQLLIPTTAGDPAVGSKLHQSQALDDKISTTVKFVATELIGVSSKEVTLQVIDGQGNITKQTFSVETDSIAQVPDVSSVGEDVATVSLPTSLPSAAVGHRLTLPITIAGGADVAGYQLEIEFDVSALRYISSANADYLPVGAFVVPALVSGNRVTLAATALNGSSDGSGTLATLVFEARTATPSLPRLSAAKLTDSNADFLEVRIENTAGTEPVQLAGDVNGDGIVSLEDMDAAADRLGQTGENTADVNGNGIVDAADLLLIAAAIEQANAAPSLHSEAIVHLFTAAEVRQWLQLAWQQELTGRLYQRGFLVLEQLLAILTPEETVLLPNYPNPFNPETWIPYHLSESANVTVRIYAADGRLVRTVALGHQATGIYESRSRAAYWDGRNDVGEPVASGVYFYTLTADDFAATRKLLIRK